MFGKVSRKNIGDPFATFLFSSPSWIDSKVLRYSHGKLRFTQFSTRIYWNRSLAPSDLFHIFTQSIKFHWFQCHILKFTDVWKRWFIKLTENKQLFLLASFTVKLELIFVLTQENAFKTNRKSIGSSKKQS